MAQISIRIINRLRVFRPFSEQHLDAQRQGSSNDEFSNRNGHLPSKSFNDRPGYTGGKWYNEKRGGNNRRSEEMRTKSDFNYREQSGGRGAGAAGGAGTGNAGGSGSGATINSKQRNEREVVSADRESNSSIENNNPRRRPKAKNAHNQTNSGELIQLAIDSSKFKLILSF